MLINQDKFLKYSIYEFDEVDSTMNKVKEFIDNSVVIAKRQLNGRGKGDRVWNSESNDNLYFSILLKTTKKNDYSQVSFVASVALRYCIENSVSKWPNDILLNNKKCCGLLLEFDKNMLIIGIGINIAHYPDINTNFSATSLKQENIIIDRYTILKNFLEHFDFLYNEWQMQGFSNIRKKWLEKCYNYKKTIKVNNKEGIFLDISNDGSLLLQTNKEIIEIKSGDVF
jgi:BirA family biotin operon repressor/biotin-[acetyl-CoA-carboxylase] ligase